MKKTFSHKLMLGVAGTLVLCGGAFTTAMGSGKDSSEQYGPPVTRRLSPEQYQATIADIFGSSIELGGRFDPEMRQDGLLAVGDAQLGVTSAGMEQYDNMARTIAAQVVDEHHRGLLMPCQPADAKAPDDACAKTFLSNVGRLLYRRPLTQEELEIQIGAAATGAKALNDFYKGLALSLATMLESPQFLFRSEKTEADPERPGGLRLDPYSKAAQLSFFLWNAAPDTELLNAAESGKLNTAKGLAQQVDRMLASPRLEVGLRAFFTDMLGFDEIPQLVKDATLFPKFSAQVASDAQEQTLKTIVDLLLTHKGDYRDLFTTSKTFLTQALGSIYRVPVPNDGPNGGPDMWQPYTFAAGDPRAGILSQVSFVALHSPPGRSSPTLRGKALREIMLCQKVPPPPGNVDFKIVQDTNNPDYKTARARLEVHRTNPVCAGCHKLIDPMGLSLENFDADGAYRTTENGAPIDASGMLDGVAFKDAAGLGKAMHDNPATTSCVLSRMTAYGLGRTPSDTDAAWVDKLKKDFEKSGYRIVDLMRDIATSPEFYRVALPNMKAASADHQTIVK
jgi:hypothetical protein